MDAWKNTFLFQNNEDRHSWFFCFDKTFKKQNIPFWFVDWWWFYGPITEILPPPIIEAYNTFTKHSEPLTLCPTTLSFFIHCNLSWIMYWDYIIEESPQAIPTLQRQFWTNWWNKYDLSKCTSETILRSLKSKSHQDQQFTLTKSQIQATIASSSTKKELQEQIKKLQDALDNTPDEDDDNKQKETNLLLKLADKIDNPELKIEYLLKLKDLITNEPSTPMSQPYTLQKIFQRFEDSSTPNITLQDLQKEIKDTKQELQKFKQKTKKRIIHLEQVLLQKHSFSSSSDKEIEQIDQGETSTKFINLIERITYQKWHVNITITIQDSFKLQTIALIDSGAQMNCIQEGLIPTKYFEKTKQKLSTANGENLRVNFKVTDVHICNEGICIKQSFILVKDLDIGIILGQPFLEIIKPFTVTNEGITTKIFQQKIMFAFNEKPITKNIDFLKTFSLFKEHSIKMIEAKENHLQELSNKKLENQLQNSQIKERIDSIKNNMIKNLCSDLPDEFWHRKQHMISLPYEKNFTKQNIPIKVKPIQINYELMKYCEKDIQELLNKKLIEPSKSLWSCTTFCVQKSVINYKTIKIRFYTSFEYYEWTIILLSSQNASKKIQKIMNEFFKPFSSFPI
ncbi:hypothetical protein CFOL_v3_32481 [Cephalotus follicularis]|uniref:Retropepsins domain-containing protein n=1 Tax=Cephalotus follicularis TaxID=3775 RepID=A0A1Q3D9E3_CEPFO|nr:hypothetical protein CFOL_v3_32481 [Cephalotus follicularis]